MKVSCNCGAVMGLYDTGDPGWMSESWQAYDEHTMEQT